MNILAPSILAADFWRLGNQLDEIAAVGVQYVHIDVMDGHFVPNISVGLPVVASLRAKSSLVFDVHLMISEPEKYIAPFAGAGADIIGFHLEAAKDPVGLAAEIHRLGKRASLTVNPETPVSCLFPFAEYFDMILLMSVHPGFGGQRFIGESLARAAELHAFIRKNKLDTDIEMDGGIGLDNLKAVLDSGVNVIVAGSAVFEKNPAAAVREFLKVMS